MRKLTNIIGLVAIVVTALVLVVSFKFSPASADSYLQQAYEMRMKAQRGHCVKIGQKILACYSGDANACKTLQASVTWFTNEYGEPPEIACLAQERPFGNGDGQK